MNPKPPAPNTRPSPPKDSKHDDDERRKAVRRQVNYSVTYLIASLIGLWLFQQFVLQPLAVQSAEISYSDFKDKLKSGQIVDLTITDSQLVGDMKNPSTAAGAAATVPFTTVQVPGPPGDTQLIAQLDEAGVRYSVAPPPSPLGSFLLAYGLPLVLIGGIWYFMYRRSAGGGGRGGGLGGLLGIGRSKAAEVKPEDVGVTYADVGGADEAIAELREVIDFLKTPEQAVRLGGHIPRGVLLVGPPGTGKTLLAKATAGEAHVPFFETSGSEFIEMFVGVGAARVRDLFEQARKVAPAVVFIDEIDAIGQSRANSARLGGNDEREQTLNQLLAELDGFRTDSARPVIIMAATNRPEVLDPALLRAGRFDRQVAVGNPDLTGRLQILRIHARGVKLAANFDLERAARITPGMSGADLANVLNEAALLASRRQAEAVTNADFEAAIERIVAGMEHKTRRMNDAERTAVAYHESGHALVAALVPRADPVTKISIVPRGPAALGYTLQAPTEDRYLMSREELEDRLAVMLGGRSAEVVVFNTISTGASDDIQRATELARRMVTEFGMSERLGSVRYAGQQLAYLGGSAEDDSNVSPQTREVIDEEVKRLITTQYERAQALLKEHRAALETLAQQLLKDETVDGAAVAAALKQNP